jgi:putative transposase
MARIHRSAVQWQHFIELWQASGQSAAQFCKTHELGYVSFCKWRQRLEADEQQAIPTQFIDLSTLTQPTSAARWSIVLSLGNGVELKLDQL